MRVERQKEKENTKNRRRRIYSLVKMLCVP